MMLKKTKPSGWWTTHPTILMASIHGCRDSNGDGLGDFRGYEQQLDFFKDLGISGFRIPHVGRYGDDYKWQGLVQQDWFDVDPHYGNMNDFDSLMKAMAERDMKVFIMPVIEYVGWQHPDYLAAKDAREKGIDDPRVKWFLWKDDGTVLTCWDRPGPDVSNQDYVDAYLKHIGFWMDKGILGFDSDAVGTWHNLNLDTLRRWTEFVINKGGFVTAENMVLEDERTTYSGFNGGTGYLRHEYWNEVKAITEHKADYIRNAIKVRRRLIDLGMFPYNHLGNQSFQELTDFKLWHVIESFKLQVAFNAALPDMIWVSSSALTFSEPPKRPFYQTEISPVGRDMIHWDEIEKQMNNPDSIFSHVKKMFRLRAENKELAIGEIEELETNNYEDVFAALRISEDGTERAVVVFNFTDYFKDVVISLNDNSIRKLRNYLSGEVIELVHTSLRVKLYPYGFKFLKVLK